MEPLISILIGLLVVVILLQVRAYLKLKQKSKLILVQSREIKRQIQEQEKRNKEVGGLVHEKQQLIGLVSHDLKGPFNRIFALIQLMELTNENLTEEQREYLGKIHQIVADGLSMIRNLLDNRRLEEQGIDQTPEQINLVLALGSLVKNYRALAVKKKIQIQFDPPAQAFVLADKMYLNRIFENLISNALKFSPEGKNIYVSIEEKGDKYAIGVRDEGPGISREDQKNLYRKFQRLSARPTGGESSTGLGLSIVKTLIEKMGGEIYCQSEEGNGTTFTVKLEKITGEPIKKENQKVAVN
ncbi:MAG TPA: HAMP domain-containing sensor histidine kinase [Cyclobacteriaceae bacterium]|nr:HAMP domain-containing sensor histidine kinase [Cyclobacteriaceae bacterium]HNU41368.1 HAMP domain-containing sensor histidine kinase [Cyclobacteriaceae bacterium]